MAFELICSHSSCEHVMYLLCGIEIRFATLPFTTTGSGVSGSIVAIRLPRKFAASSVNIFRSASFARSLSPHSSQLTRRLFLHQHQPLWLPSSSSLSNDLFRRTDQPTDRPEEDNQRSQLLASVPNSVGIFYLLVPLSVASLLLCWCSAISVVVAGVCCNAQRKLPSSSSQRRRGHRSRGPLAHKLYSRDATG